LETANERNNTPLTPQPVTARRVALLATTIAGFVSEPQANSPAAKAGIASGDVITTLDGASMRDARELSRKVGTMAPGTSVKLGLIHDGQENTVTLTLGTLPNEKQAANEQEEHEVPDSEVPKLGLTVTAALRSHSRYIFPVVLPLRDSAA
jgi:serine protease Do